MSKTYARCLVDIFSEKPMAKKTIFFDESGFTGYNLLDPAQPIFSIASAEIENAQALQILKKSFPSYQASEYKFANIWNTGSRSGLIEFARHLPEFADRSFVYFINKRFGVLTKIVDFLIEPYITDAGFDFYADGFCWKYANYIHFGLQQFAPPELLDSLVRQYQAFSRNPTRETLAQLQYSLALKAASTEEPVQIFLEQMELGARVFDRYHSLEQFRGSDELQLTTMVAIIAHWRQRHVEDFAVIHDKSSNFLRSQKFWDNITAADVPKQLHRMGGGSFVEFPLRVISTTAADSKDSFSIQFCDVLAGLTTKHFSPLTVGADRDFLNGLIDAGFKHISYNGVRPDTIFPDEIPPKRLNGPDVVDQMTDIIFRRFGSP